MKKKKNTEKEKILRTPKNDRAAVILFALIVFGLTVLGIVIPDKTFSEGENRSLASFPAFSFKTVMNGEFEQGLSDYLSDQFPLRSLCVSVRAFCETAMGKKQNNGVIDGKDGYVFAREDVPSRDALDENLTSIARFAAYAKGKGVPTSLCVVGRKIDVETDKLPPLYGTSSQDALWEDIDARAGALEDVTYTNLRNVLLSDTSGKQLYYSTDHHWTTYGAFAAYRAVIRSLPFAPSPRGLDFFTEEKLSDSFFGTTWSKSGMSWKDGEDMICFRFEGDEEITVEFVGENRTMNGFYDRSFLDKKDKYAAFLSENHAYLKIRGQADPTRGKLLIVKDSFAHCLIPMLAPDYDMDVLDLRYYKNVPARLLEDGGYDGILILCGSDLLTEDCTPLNFALLRAGV